MVQYTLVHPPLAGVSSPAQWPAGRRFLGDAKRAIAAEHAAMLGNHGLAPLKTAPAALLTGSTRQTGSRWRGRGEPKRRGAGRDTHPSPDS